MWKKKITNLRVPENNLTAFTFFATKQKKKHKPTYYKYKNRLVL